ncbi:RDD family protein [Nocardioides acrostichi]|uniref:RDD family protein n=1 Tax=Nocardioides acrostichi TaxID=2784339 RepID=A0A930UVY3_9ACTN|nr:RDD family protein [Nocardioides acrostichi]MBF4160075.1 RDD family protein [Nocardioides acrostichi]
MSNTPAGWYPDPTPPAGHAPALRWWDGERWTAHTAPSAPPSAGAAASVPSTPDGVAVAGWGRRVGAYLIDMVIQQVLAVAIGFPFVRAMTSAYVDYIDEAFRVADTGRQPDTLGFYRDILPSILGFYAVVLVVSFAYTVAFLAWKQATPGKLAVGLRVRQRDADGGLPLGCILKRWLVTVACQIAGPLFYLDVLWPLWDDKRQALHEKWAGTNVVRR